MMRDRPNSPHGERGADKVSRLPVRIETPASPPQRKPEWIKAKAPTHPEVQRLKQLLRAEGLHTVCEEASCPNLGECFGGGTATFMIMGRLCTRRCPFCDVAHGRPDPLDAEEPARLARTVAAMGLRYVVITSVDRDDLRDGGGAHFAACIAAVRSAAPGTSIEVLVPDFRGRVERALDALDAALPNVFNHNLETVPRLYRLARPGADYAGSLALLRAFRQRHPDLPTKSGIMLGLGEERAEVEALLQDLRAHDCDRLTLGQYLQPSRAHLPVVRYVPPDEFADLATYARAIGFTHVASGPLVRSSYHAEQQASGGGI
ncbi:MAG: lipoyl synthase [Gammaproteobacteria bacterium]|nr:lipoyl synthase [Gammaproteobacteria bacterium]